MAKVKVLVVEDEIITADDICFSLEELGYEVLEPANTYSEAVRTLEAELPDIAILDIRLTGKKSGIDLADKINADFGIPFIFLSSSSDQLTVQEAKKVNPSAFLIKPFHKEELFSTIEVALHNFTESQRDEKEENIIIKNALFVKLEKKFIRLNFDDILFLKSDHVYINLQTVQGEVYTIRGSLNKLEEQLGSPFFRTNRSFLVHLDHLVSINASTLQLGEHEVPVGKKQRETLLARLSRV
jgi:DNA-binding LytR/AlgR family response regulator